MRKWFCRCRSGTPGTQLPGARVTLATCSSGWQATIDVENRPRWTPTVTATAPPGQGAFGLGGAARLKQTGQAETMWR